MNWRAFITLLIGFCLTSWTFAEFAEARGGRGGGGGGFSRGGGGSLSRGGENVNYGSIRNSARPAARDVARPSGGAVTHPSQGQVSDRMAGQRPAAGGDRPGQGQRPTQRGENLSSAQKDQLRQKYQESGGLNPSQLPSRDRDQIREDWENNRDDAREDWQDWRDDAREDWQDWYHHEYHDDWDDHWYSPWWYGYPVSAVSFSFYINDTPPCQKTVIINQATGSTTYYYCNAMWYQPAYSEGEVRYIVTAPPAGAELPALTDPYKVTVGGQDYFVSNHVFYQKITRDGQALYVTVDAPPGARVPTIPQYAVQIEHQGQFYYRFDKIFYVRQGDFFVVAANPGV